MKKHTSALISALTAAALLAGCATTTTDSTAATDASTTVDSSAQAAEAQTVKVVTTIFPLYDWTQNIVGDDAANIDLSLLMDSGVDMHSFQPTTDDMIAIAECDLFIYVGGESDEWIEDALANATNPDMQVLNLMEVLGDAVKVEELKEGMQVSEHTHDHDEEEGEADEHVWLSLRNAQVVCQAISETLATLDGDNASTYSSNTSAYIGELQTLDDAYQTAIDAASMDTLLFADRFPFRYMVDDYSLDYYAAFIGCSAETEASFETLAFLTDKVDELNVATLLVIDGSDETIAQAIIAASTAKNQDILMIDSMQSVSADDIAAGTTYLSTMEYNLEVLIKALQ